MTVGQRVTAHVSLGSGGSATLTATDFSTTDGTALGSSDAVVITGYVHENDVTIRRVGDPDGDGVFEIGVDIESRTGAGERADVHHVATDVAGLEVVEAAAAAQEVLVYGVRLDADKVFVEQGAGVTAGAEIVRTPSARGQTETIYELVAGGGDALLRRRHDPDDDGVFELDAAVATISSEVLREAGIGMSDASGRANPQMETALEASGGARDLMLLGTIGLEGL